MHVVWATKPGSTMYQSLHVGNTRVLTLNSGGHVSMLSCEATWFIAEYRIVLNIDRGQTESALAERYDCLAYGFARSFQRRCVEYQTSSTLES